MLFLALFSCESLAVWHGGDETAMGDEISGDTPTTPGSGRRLCDDKCPFVEVLRFNIESALEGKISGGTGVFGVDTAFAPVGVVGAPCMTDSSHVNSKFSMSEARARSMRLAPKRTCTGASACNNDSSDFAGLGAETMGSPICGKIPRARSNCTSRSSCTASRFAVWIFVSSQ
jgi:hypothetical protein